MTASYYDAISVEGFFLHIKDRDFYPMQIFLQNRWYLGTSSKRLLGKCGGAC
jgi:hypothetical protein